MSVCIKIVKEVKVQSFPVLLFLMMLNKLLLIITFESVDRILWCDYSKGSH